MIVFTLHQAIVCDLKYENELTSLAFLKKPINNIGNSIMLNIQFNFQFESAIQNSICN